MSKFMSLIKEVKEHAVTLKDTIESEKIKHLNLKIERLDTLNDHLEKENKQLRSLVGRVIEDLEKENKRNKTLLSNLNNI